MSENLELKSFTLVSPDSEGDFEIQRTLSSDRVIRYWAYISKEEAKQLIEFLQKHIEVDYQKQKAISEYKKCISCKFYWKSTQTFLLGSCTVSKVNHVSVDKDQYCEKYIEASNE